MKAGRALFCTYFEALHLSAPGAGDAPAATVAYHEAGHAVAGYALGLGCSRIAMQATLDEDGTDCISGQVFWAKAAQQRVRSLLRRGQYHPFVAAVGIHSMAGPAAERKFSILAGVNLHHMGGSLSVEINSQNSNASNHPVKSVLKISFPYTPTSNRWG